MSGLETAQREIEQLREKLRQSQAACLQAWTFSTRHVVMNSTDEAYFVTDFNGVRALIPRDTLRTMIHCVHASRSARSPFSRKHRQSTRAKSTIHGQRNSRSRPQRSTLLSEMRS